MTVVYVIHLHAFENFLTTSIDDRPLFRAETLAEILLSTRHALKTDKLYEVRHYTCYAGPFNTMSAYSSPDKDLYKILGVSPTAEREEIRNAFQELALKLHPKKNNGDERKSAMFFEVNEAYDILTDREQRYSYDLCRVPPLAKAKITAPSGYDTPKWSSWNASFSGQRDSASPSPFPTTPT